VNQIINEAFGGRIRVRVCALCLHENKILVVKHKGLGRDYFLAPPGGGVELFESMEMALSRELREEANLALISAQFSFVYEYIKPPLHAVEMFYWVEWEGELKKGIDPEMGEQIIENVFWIDDAQLLLEENENKHAIFTVFKSIRELKENKTLFLKI
jgi:8-oxo-dGTP diphosphatase